ncbi:MAG: hypothetical protein C4534_07240 [Gaiellales bacterium]|nr:MAG: hypothetical protein C4534_07240 [Gaiellales bacterium]
MAALVLAAAGCGDTGPAATAKDFIQAAFENDCATLFDLSSSSSLGGQPREDAIRECEESDLRGQLFGAIGEVKLEDFETLQEDIGVGGDTAMVRARLSMKIGEAEQSVEQDFRLVMEDGKWKVDL